MKQLITVENLDTCIGADGKCYIGPNQIISPGAKDELARRRVGLVYGEKPESHCSCAGSSASACCKKGSICDPDELAIAIAALLKKECGITEPGQLRALTMETLKRVAKMS